jgi:hypothetical protein
MPSKLLENAEKFIAMLYQENNNCRDRIKKNIKPGNQENEPGLDTETLKIQIKENNELVKKIREIENPNNYYHTVNPAIGWIWLIAIALINLAVLISAVTASIALGIIGLAIFNFFNILGLANYVSGTNPFNTGEFRQAITSTFVFAYLSVIIMAVFSNNEIIGNISNNNFMKDFSVLTGTIVGFYFVSRAIQPFTDKNKANTNTSATMSTTQTTVKKG